MWEMWILGAWEGLLDDGRLKMEVAEGIVVVVLAVLWYYEMLDVRLSEWCKACYVTWWLKRSRGSVVFLMDEG